ncbi:HAD family hydrolase [Sulfurimonas sp.]
MQKIVIFDMDGTLIDSKKDITISINYVREQHHNLPPLSENFIVEAINMHVRNLPKLFYNTEVYEAKDKELFEKHYKEQCIKNPYLYRGVLELLQKLKEANIKLSIATNAPTKFAITMFEHLGVAHMFDMIIGADKVSASKPSPEMIEKILDFYNFNVEGDEAWMVGDNTKDIQSAHNANIKAIFATWGFSADAKHTVVANTPSEVADIVLQ